MAKRCSPCDINFPPGKDNCLACGEELWNEGSPFDNDWSAKADTLKRRNERRRQGYVPDADLDLTIVNDQPWIAHALLVREGYEPELGDVVLIRGRHYELSSAYSADEWYAGWWLQPIDVEAMIEENLGALPVYAAPEA